MKSTSVSVFENTLSKTNQWLGEIRFELGWDDQEKAYKALRVVLHTLRDMLPVKEVTDLSAQLPMLVRGIYFEGWNPNRKPTKMRTALQFADKVNSNFPEFDYANDFADPEEVTRAVLMVLAEHISPGEIEDVIGCLPKGLKVLWD